MAPSPSSSGISRSRVTRSGSYWWIFASASIPLRAVATTRNSPAAWITSVRSRRQNGLSSTTSTAGTSELTDTMAHRAGGHLAGREVEDHGASVVSADPFPGHGDAVGVQRFPRREHVPLAGVNESG